MSSEFDDLDRALASGLSALAPEVVGGDDALASMRPVFTRARHRRRVARAGATFAVLLAVGTIAVLSSPSSSRSHVNVTSPPTSPGPTRPPVGRTSTTRPKQNRSTTTTTVPESSTVPSTSGTQHSGTTGRTTPVTTPATPTTTPQGGGPGPSGGGGDNGGSSTTTTFTGQGGIKTYTSPGGSITVRFSRGVLSLVSVDARRGFTHEVKDNGPDRVEVRFFNGDQTEYRIVVEIEHGEPVQTAHHGPGQG